MSFNVEREAEYLLRRLEKSNKIFAASVATEGWKTKKVFPMIKEKYPEAQLHECGRIIYLITRKEQEEKLIKHLQKRKTEYEEKQKSGTYAFGEDAEMVKTALEEIEEVLNKLEE